MIRKHLLLFAIVSVLMAGTGLGVWAIFLRPIKVQVARVERDVPVQVFGLGTVEARVQSKIGFKVSGVLVDLAADVGDRVAKGAVLARLDSREQGARLARAKAAVEQAEANLQKATASLEKAEANYANAKSINERRQKLAQTNITSVEAAETAQAARTRRGRRREPREERDRRRARRHQRCQSAARSRNRRPSTFTL